MIVTATHRGDGVDYGHRSPMSEYREHRKHKRRRALESSNIFLPEHGDPPPLQQQSYRDARNKYQIDDNSIIDERIDEQTGEGSVVMPELRIINGVSVSALVRREAFCQSASQN